MQFEQVYTVWDIYDGIRSGLADRNGVPHYFSSVVNNVTGEYSDEFELRKIDENLLRLAQEQWAIFRNWETKYHNGKEFLAAHPGHEGNNARYDQLENAISSSISMLTLKSEIFLAEFRQLPDQYHLPLGILREMQVRWMAK